MATSYKKNFEMVPGIRKRSTKVSDLLKNESNEGFYLSTSLYPIWKFTHFTGILFDWCVPIDKPEKKYYKIRTVLRWFIIIVSFTFIFSMITFQSITLVNVLREMTPINAVAMSLIWFSVIPIAMHTQLFFIFRRRELLDFFRKFLKMERKLVFIPSHRNRLRSSRRIIYGVLLSSFLSAIVGVGAVLSAFSDEPYFYTNSKSLRDLFSPAFLVVISMITYSLVSFFILMVDIIPTLVYYHSGLALLAIYQELKLRLISSTKSANHRASLSILEYPEQVPSHNIILSVWSRYDQVRQMVTKTDQLFGALLLNNIGTKFFLICTLAYSTLYYLFQNNKNKADDSIGMSSSKAVRILVANLIVYILRLSTMVVFSSHLLEAAETVRMETSSLFRRCWGSVDPETRNAMRAFRVEQERELVAFPSNLFRITPSLLLTMTGLIVSYVIVLLQAKW